MIPKVKELKLICIYLYICEIYDSHLKYACERFSNNNQPEFTDQEVLTVYLFGMSIEHQYRLKYIHEFANDYLRSWFPKLPSYVAFNIRINRLNEACRLLVEVMIAQFQPTNLATYNLLDSMPIITCSGKRTNKVARELCNKGYCSTKNMFYHGVRLHALGFSQTNTLPFPEQLLITSASENDLNVFKQAWGGLLNRIFIGDKIYFNAPYFQQLEQTNNSVMITPVKAVKGQADAISKRDKAADDLFSTAVSRLRQPIESFFNWLIEKTDIQRASKVRSYKGLLVHVFGRLAAAFLYLIF